MTATIVHVYVKPEFVSAFIEATRENHTNSILEHGNLRFDILQDAKDPAKFVLYEVYQGESDVLAHKETTHYAVWRDTVAPWMDKPREGIKHKLVFPESK